MIFSKRTTWVFPCLLLLFGLVACRGGQPETPTPAPTIAGPPIQPDPVSLITLVRNPVSFVDQFIAVSGRYRPIPLMTCNNDAHMSPATWALTEPDIEILASGSDSELRQLAEPGLELIVEGRWRQWEGPVGCGRRVPVQQIWYLDVSRIIAPNPITASSQEDQEVAGLPETTPSPAVTGQPTAAITATPEQFPSLTATPSPTQSPGPTLSPTAPVAPSPTPTESANATSTPIPVATEPENSTATASPTGEAGETPTATLVPGGGGTIGLDELIKESIGPASVHRWDYIATESGELTVSVAPSLELDVQLELLDVDGESIAVQDNGGTGQSEVISDVELTVAGLYQILVTPVNSTEGLYALVAQNSASEPFLVFMETLEVGDVGAGELAAGTDHLWNFEGAPGDVISIMVMNGGDGDLLLYLIGPDSAELLLVDDGEIGEDEEISEFQLPATGLYSIGVGELDFEPAEYTLSLE